MAITSYSVNFFRKRFLKHLRFSSSLVFAEHNNKTYSYGFLNSISAASKLNDNIECLVIGNSCSQVAEQISKVKEVKKVHLVESNDLEFLCPEILSPVIKHCIDLINPNYFVAASSTFTKNLIPRLSALMDLAPVTDILSIISHDTFTRPTYAGNAISTVKLKENLKLLTIRPTSFKPALHEGGNGKIEKIEVPIQKWSKTSFISRSLTKSDLPELSSANVIVSGGRGLKNEAGFKSLYDLAKLMNAAVGASRAAVDSGFAPSDLQIGQTGKVVAPELYIAFGISGAIQHLAGMKDSKTIVAINTDPEAPIFKVSDLGLVEDAFKVIPSLISELKKQ